MARTSTRNYQNLFRNIGVDDSAQGPDVSEDTQLVYIADELSRTADLELGGRAAEAAVVGEHGFLTLSVNAPRGVEIVQLTAHGSAAPTAVVQLFIWGSQVQPAVTGGAGVLSTLRSGHLVPLSVLTSGTLATGAIPTAAFIQLNDVEFKQFYFTGPSAVGTVQHLNIAFGTANLATIMALRWRELRLF